MQKTNTKTNPISSFQLNYEKGLQIAAYILCVVHMTLAAFRYVIDNMTIRPYERWFGLLLAAASLFYLILVRVRYPASKSRISNAFSRLRSNEQRIAFGLLGWLIISCLYHHLMSGRNYMKPHDWAIFDMAVDLLLLMPMACFFGRELGKKAIETAIHVTAGTYSVYTLWGLWNVFRLHIINLPSGGQIGMDSKTRLYLGPHYNITGAIAVTMLALCLYMVFQKKKVIKICYLIAGLGHLTVVMLSNSRTVFVAGLVMVIAAAFMYSWNRFADKEFRMRILISTAAAVCAGVIFWGIRPLTFFLFENITHFKEKLGSQSSISNDIRALSGLSRREVIWAASLKVMFSSPKSFLFGVTPAEVTNALMQIGGVKFQAAHAHNEILQMGTALGVPAMVSYIAFHLLICLRCIQILFRKKEDPADRDYMIPVVILCLVVMDLAEAYLFGYYSIMGCVFFLFCGWAVGITDSPQIRIKKPSQKSKTGNIKSANRK